MSMATGGMSEVVGAGTSVGVPSVSTPINLPDSNVIHPSCTESLNLMNVGVCEPCHLIRTL